MAECANCDSDRIQCGVCLNCGAEHAETPTAGEARRRTAEDTTPVEKAVPARPKRTR